MSLTMYGNEKKDNGSISGEKPLARIADSFPGLMNVLAELGENNERIRRSAAELGGSRHNLAATPSRNTGELIESAIKDGASKFDVLQVVTEQLLYAAQDTRKLADSLEHLASGSYYGATESAGMGAIAGGRHY